MIYVNLMFITLLSQPLPSTGSITSNISTDKTTAVMSVISTVLNGGGSAASAAGFDSASHTYLSGNSNSSSSSSPARTSPTGSLVHQALVNINHKISGIPCVAAASRYTAPVHIDVGGAIYTSSLETLTK